MQSVRKLIDRIDVELGDTASVRIIPLTHLAAAEVAPQLQQAYASGAATVPADQDAAARTGRAAGPDSNVPAGLRVPTSPPAGGEEDGFAHPGFSAPGLGAASSQPSPVSERFPVSSEPELATTSAPSAPASGEMRIIPDTRNNALMIYSSFDAFQRLREVVRALDVPDSQVVVEATILEVRINDALRYGVQWYLSGGGATFRSGSGRTLVPPAGAGIGADGLFGLGDITVGAALGALQEVTDVKVLSTPYLTVINGRAARLVVGDQIPYATRTQSSSSGGNVSVTQQIEVVDTGIVLDVTPQIKANNSVSLVIKQTVSQAQASALEGNVTPVISTRTVESEILVQSGRTVLLGGLIQDRREKTDEGVPGLKDVPVLGGLFRSKNENAATRTELVVLITPRVARHSSQLEGITNVIRNSLARR
nr:secretin N-terminal domain-containing protein [Chthonobacter rhizosphaerae]